MYKKFFSNVFFNRSFNSFSKINISENLEIAFFGYSNCGKSSIINSLTNKKKISRVSKKPGSTVMINFFQVQKKFFLVDFPGYGYIKKNKNYKLHVKKLIFKYLRLRKELISIILLMDIRNPLKVLDKLFLNYVKFFNISIIILLTKSDKINIQERKKKFIFVREYISIFPNIINIIVCSSFKKYGLDLLRKQIFSIYKENL